MSAFTDHRLNPYASIVERHRAASRYVDALRVMRELHEAEGTTAGTLPTVAEAEAYFRANPPRRGRPSREAALMRSVLTGEAATGHGANGGVLGANPSDDTLREARIALDSLDSLVRKGAILDRLANRVKGDADARATVDEALTALAMSVIRAYGALRELDRDAFSQWNGDDESRGYKITGEQSAVINTDGNKWRSSSLGEHISGPSGGHGVCLDNVGTTDNKGAYFYLANTRSVSREALAAATEDEWVIDWSETI